MKSNISNAKSTRRASQQLILRRSRARNGHQIELLWISVFMCLISCASILCREQNTCKNWGVINSDGGICWLWAKKRNEVYSTHFSLLFGVNLRAVIDIRWVEQISAHDGRTISVVELIKRKSKNELARKKCRRQKNVKCCFYKSILKIPLNQLKKSLFIPDVWSMTSWYYLKHENFFVSNP